VPVRHAVPELAAVSYLQHVLLGHLQRGMP
jgi:hypothetical protein